MNPSSPRAPRRAQDRPAPRRHDGADRADTGGDRRRSGARADGPGVGTPTVVSVGDSYISGEGGRWAGNTNGSSINTDALGSTAYYDNARTRRDDQPLSPLQGGRDHHRRRHQQQEPRLLGREDVDRHRRDGDFKPGLDFYNGSAGQGQALMLQNFAATHNVKMVNLSIGGNNFNFASIVQTCVDRLADLADVVEGLLQRRLIGDAQLHVGERQRARRRAIKNAILNITTAMTNAGYSASQYAIVVQDYMSPLPTGSGIRYGGVGLHASEHRRLRILERRRQLGQQLGAADDQQLGQERRRADRSLEHEDHGAPVDVQRAPAVREHGRPARGAGPRRLDRRRRGRPDRVDRADPHALDGLRRRTTSRSRCTPTTGASGRCATACARPTTAARRAAGRAPARPTA